MTQRYSQTYKIKQRARPTVGIALAISLSLTVAGCANSPKISIPVFETPVAYAGLGVGASMLDVDTTGKDFTQIGSTSAAAQLTVGLEMADSWALELRGADLGEAEFDNDLKLGYQVADLTILGKLSLGTKTKVFGRVGLGALENDGDFEVRQRNQNHVVLGVGLDIGLSRRVGLRLEAMGHDVDASHAQVSLIYRFNPRASAVASIATSSVDATTNPSVAIPTPVTSDPTSKAVVNPAKPSITPIPTITPKPGRIEPQTKPQVRDRVKPIVPAIVSTPGSDPIGTFVADADKDGVADAVDACASSLVEAIVNAQGCDFFGTATPGVVFADGAATLDADAKEALNEFVASLQEFPTIKVAIGAYSPLTGDPATDLLLSRRRTIAVMRYMQGEGINAARTQPIANELVAKEGGESLVNRIAIRQRK